MASVEPIIKKSKKRRYNSEWENLYGLVEFDNNTAFCVLCDPPKPFTRFLKSNHENHFIKFHSDVNQKKGEDKMEIIKARKSLLNYEAAERVDNSSETRTRISFLVAHQIANEMLPFEHGESIKNIVSLFTDEIFKKCPKLQGDIREVISNIPLSRRVITRRIVLMSENIYNQIDRDLQQCECFSLQLDESTDVADIAQIIIFIRMVVADLSVKEECFGFLSIHDRATAAEMFRHFHELITSRGLPTTKLFSITTDGAATMAGCRNGFIARVRDEPKLQSIQSYHCIIHQQVLCAKALNINNVIDDIINIINFIRGRSLNHRQFKDLIKKMDDNSHECDLIYYTEVRWLSKGNMLRRFVKLLPIIREFLLNKEKNEWVQKIEDFQWLSIVMYASDLTEIINSNNRKLQGKNKYVWEQMHIIRDLEVTLQNIVYFCEKNQIDGRLERLKQLHSENPNAPFPRDTIVNATAPILLQLSNRFKDFNNIEIVSRIFMNPLSINRDNFNDLVTSTKCLFGDASWIKYSEFVSELELLPRDNVIMTVISSGGDWLHNPQTILKYPTILKIYMRVKSVFGSTYLSESGFSFMKRIKTGERSRLTDDHLGHLFTLKTTEREPDLCEIISSLQLKSNGVDDEEEPEESDTADLS